MQMSTAKGCGYAPRHTLDKCINDILFDKYIHNLFATCRTEQMSPVLTAIADAPCDY